MPGEIAFVSQSGALVTAVLDWARSRRIGFSHMVSLGERADVDFGDLLDHLASDPHTRSILLYIESIESPRKFMSAARAAARNKPVIVVKAGRAGNGLQAAASHTGALAGSDVVIDAAIRRAGMLRVDTLQDLFMAAETLAHFRGNPRRGLTLMTNGGGAGVMAADAAALAGVDLPPLSEAVRRKLDDVLPPTWSRGNPIDIIGDAPVERYTATLRALLDDPDAGTVLFMHAPTAIVRSEDIARACAPLAREAAGRLMGCWLGDAGVAEARRIFEEAGVAGYETPEEAVRAFAMLASYQRNQALLAEAPTASEAAPPDSAAARAIVEAALDGGREMLDELEAKAVLKAYGIPIVPTVAVGPSADAAVEAARTIGHPVALKILSPDISHKSDVGGVVLGLGDDAAVRLAVEHMLARVRSLKPAARITGFTVQSMVRRPYAQELIVGASVDPVFGPVILFGQGGTAVEVIADRAIGLPPLNRVLARDLVSANARREAARRLPRPSAGAHRRDLRRARRRLADARRPARAGRARHQSAAGRWRRRDRPRCPPARRARCRARGRHASRSSRIRPSSPRPGRGRVDSCWCGRSGPKTRHGIAPSRCSSRPRTSACASSACAASCRAASSPAWCRSTTTARWRSSPSRRSPTARCGRSASCAPSPIRTTSRPSSRSSSVPMRRGRDSASACSTRWSAICRATARSAWSRWCCARTAAMRELATRSGFELDTAGSDNTSLRYVLELKPAASPAA